MTIRTRLSLWYTAVLSLCLVIISVGTYRELVERHRIMSDSELARNAIDETGELVFQGGLPAILLGCLAGWWLTRRALAPVTALTRAAERINEHNLGQQIPRTGNHDELDRLTEVLNAMTARLNNSFARIREFTLHASHELKTPLAVLHGQIETSLRDEPLSASQREVFASQLDELRRLTRIVDSLTLLAKADAGLVQLTLLPVHLDSLVRDIFADTEILAEACDVRVELNACEPLVVKGDASRLRQLLLNLADNAVKYNRPGGHISMALRRDAGSAEFTISNTGPGIAADALPNVFDRFFRGDPAHSNAVESCGLGLSIAQWIVSVHDGTIRIESEPASLTKVSVHFPLVHDR